MAPGPRRPELSSANILPPDSKRERRRRKDTDIFDFRDCDLSAYDVSKKEEQVTVEGSAYVTNVTGNVLTNKDDCGSELLHAEQLRLPVHLLNPASFDPLHSASVIPRAKQNIKKIGESNAESFIGVAIENKQSFAPDLKNSRNHEASPKRKASEDIHGDTREVPFKKRLLERWRSSQATSVTEKFELITPQVLRNAKIPENEIEKKEHISGVVCDDNAETVFPPSDFTGSSYPLLRLRFESHVSRDALENHGEEKHLSRVDKPNALNSAERATMQEQDDRIEQIQETTPIAESSERQSDVTYSDLLVEPSPSKNEPDHENGNVIPHLFINPVELSYDSKIPHGAGNVITADSERKLQAKELNTIIVDAGTELHSTVCPDIEPGVSLNLTIKNKTEDETRSETRRNRRNETKSAAAEAIATVSDERKRCQLERRLRHVKRMEFQKIRGLAHLKSNVKVNVRGRNKLDALLNDASLEVRCAVEQSSAEFNWDSGLSSGHSTQRRTVLDAMTNESLRILEALICRLQSREGRAVWKTIVELCGELSNLDGSQ